MINKQNDLLLKWFLLWKKQQSLQKVLKQDMNTQAVGSDKTITESLKLCKT